MNNQQRDDLAENIRLSLVYFERSTEALEEKDSEFRPTDSMMSVAQQVAHVAHSIHWLLNGAFSPDGFDMNFDQHMKEVGAVTSLSAAREQVRSAFADVLEQMQTRPLEEWLVPIVPNPVMAGEPRYHALDGVIDHTAHHRGALTVYSRLLGKTPAMPYM